MAMDWFKSMFRQAPIDDPEMGPGRDYTGGRIERTGEGTGEGRVMDDGDIVKQTWNQALDAHADAYESAVKTRKQLDASPQWEAYGPTQAAGNGLSFQRMRPTAAGHVNQQLSRISSGAAGPESLGPLMRDFTQSQQAPNPAALPSNPASQFYQQLGAAASAMQQQPLSGVQQAPMDLGSGGDLGGDFNMDWLAERLAAGSANGAKIGGMAGGMGGGKGKPSGEKTAVPEYGSGSFSNFQDPRGQW